MFQNDESKTLLTFPGLSDYIDQLSEQTYLCELHCNMGRKNIINFSCLNPLCPSPYNLIFDLYWVKAAKFCDSGPNILLSESFTGRLKNHAYTVAI